MKMRKFFVSHRHARTWAHARARARAHTHTHTLQKPGCVAVILFARQPGNI